MMTVTRSTRTEQKTLRSKVNRYSRTIKLTAAVFAVLYTINGAGAAAGYAKALPVGNDSSAQILAQTVWVGVAWPVVVHDMMQTEFLQRVDARPNLKG